MNHKQKYISNMYDIFEKIMVDELSKQIINEYHKNPKLATVRDAFNLSQMMYYYLSGLSETCHSAK